MALTPKRQRFVDEYLIDMNGTKAAIRAGFAESGARTEATRLLANAEVQKEIAQRTEKRFDKLEVTGNRVLEAISQIAFGDIRQMFTSDGQLKRPEEWDDDTAAAVAGLEIVTVNKGEGAVEHVAKVKRTDRLKALDMLARHHSLYNDKLEVNLTSDLATRLERAKKRKSDDG